MTVMVQILLADGDHAQFMIEPPAQRTHQDSDVDRALECLERGYDDARHWLESRRNPPTRTAKPDAIV